MDPEGSRRFPVQEELPCQVLVLKGAPGVTAFQLLVVCILQPLALANWVKGLLTKTKASSKMECTVVTVLSVYEWQR